MSVFDPAEAAVAQPLPLPLPTFAQVEPVGECNLRCPMCLLSVRAPTPTPAFLPVDDFLRLLDELPTLEDLHLQGLGEPLLHPALCDMVDEARRRGVRVSINTNLTRLTPTTARRLSRSLHTLHVSVDSADPGKYEAIRSGARFSELEAALGLLREVRRPQRPRLVFVAVLMRRTLGELEGLIRLTRRWQADALFVQHLCRLPEKPDSQVSRPNGHVPSKAALRSFFRRESLTQRDQAAVAPAFARARRLARDLGVTLRLPPLDQARSQNTSSCDWPWKRLYVTWRGELLPCCIAGLPEDTTLGRLETDSLDAIWRGLAYQGFRRRLESLDPPDVCRICSLFAGRF